MRQFLKHQVLSLLRQTVGKLRSFSAFSLFAFPLLSRILFVFSPLTVTFCNVSLKSPNFLVKVLQLDLLSPLNSYVIFASLLYQCDPLLAYSTNMRFGKILYDDTCFFKLKQLTKTLSTLVPIAYSCKGDVKTNVNLTQSQAASVYFSFGAKLLAKRYDV